MLPDGVRLVAVGDDETLTGLPHGMVDDQMGVFHETGVEGLRADAVRLLNEDPVPGIDAASHDEIGGHGGLAVGGDPQHNAPAGVGVAAEALGHGLYFVNIHSAFHSCSMITVRPSTRSLPSQNRRTASGSSFHSACSIMRF